MATSRQHSSRPRLRSSIIFRFIASFSLVIVAVFVLGGAYTVHRATQQLARQGERQIQAQQEYSQLLLEKERRNLDRKLATYTSVLSQYARAPLQSVVSTVAPEGAGSAGAQVERYRACFERAGDKLIAQCLDLQTAYKISNTLISMNKGVLTTALATLAADADVQAVYVLDWLDELYMGYAANGGGEPVHLDAPPPAQNGGLLEAEVFDAEGDEYLGKVGLLYSLDRIQALEQEARRNLSRTEELAAQNIEQQTRTIIMNKGIEVAVFMALITLLIYGLSYTFILRPVRRLQQSAEQLTAGNLDADIDAARPDEIGGLAQSFAAMRDAVRQKMDELRQAEQKYRDIFENAVEGIFQLTPDGGFINANSSMARLLGFDSAGELVESVTDSSRECYANPEEHEKLLARLQDEGRVSGVELQCKRKDGSLFWAAESARCVYGPDGGLLFFEGSMVDVTERKDREKAEQERSVAEAANEAKSSFLANMSHEIRTPMNAVIGMTELALKTQLTVKQRDYLVKIQAASRSLLGIINDILDFSKIEAGRMDLEETEFQLQTVMEGLADMLGGRAAEKHLEFMVSIADEAPCSLIGDPLRLSQVLINLTTNAIKFTGEGEVEVRAVLDPEQENTAETVHYLFTVRDTGVGVPEEKLEALFESFSQADVSTTRKYGGTGLGLAITRRLTDMMGGSVQVQSEVGQGTTFTVRIPFARQAEEKEYIPTSQSTLRGLNVLVVDDNDNARQILEEIVASFSFKARTAASGAEALEMLQTTESPFDLVLMDWSMPSMDGVETIRRMRSMEGFERKPMVVMVTAFGRSEAMEEAGDLKIDGFLDKPVNPSFLFDTIMDVFGQDLAMSTTEANAQQAAEKLAGARILLVEDQPINQQVAMEMLEDAGVSVSVAENGRQALEALQASEFDAVLMDLQMPVMDGYEAARRIRMNPAWAELPVIAMTAHAMQSDREKCLEIGMNDHISKPIESARLYATLAKWAQGHGRAATARADSPPEAPLRAAREGADIPDALPGLDVQQGLRRVKGKTGLYARLLKEFHRDFAAAGEPVRQALQEQDPARAANLAHGVKGVAANIGADALFEASLQLETACKTATQDAETMGDARRHLDAFEAALATVTAGLAQWLGAVEKGGDSSSEIDVETLRPLLQELAGQLAANAFTAPQALEPLKPALAGGEHAERFAALETAVSRFDFAASREKLEDLASALSVSLSV